MLKNIIIIVFILNILYHYYNKRTTDLFSEEDKEDMEILLGQIPIKKQIDQINDYRFELRDNYNAVYIDKTRGIAKIFVRGTITVHDIITDIKSYFSIDVILKSDIYKHTKKIMDKYKNYKIYLIGHSLGCTIVNRLSNMRTRYNIIKCKLFNPFFGFENVNFYNKNISSVSINFDVVPYLTYLRKLSNTLNMKHVYKSIPIHTLDLVIFHAPPLYDIISDITFYSTLDIGILIIFIILLYNKNI